MTPRRLLRSHDGESADAMELETGETDGQLRQGCEILRPALRGAGVSTGGERETQSEEEETMKSEKCKKAK